MKFRLEKFNHALSRPFCLGSVIYYSSTHDTVNYSYKILPKRSTLYLFHINAIFLHTWLAQRPKEVERKLQLIRRLTSWDPRRAL